MESFPKSRSFDLRELFALILKRKWIIVLPVILTSVIAYAGSYYLAPRYRSSTIIWIDRPSSVSRELSSIIGTNRSPRMGGEERRRQLQALQNEITSRTYLTQLIRNLRLDSDPEIIAAAKDIRQRSTDVTLEQVKLNLLTAKLKEQLTVRFVGADQIELIVDSEDPVMARDIVVDLTKIMEIEKTKYELEKILDNQNFADLQLERTGHIYQEAIDSLTMAQTRMAELQLPENIASELNRREILSDIDKTELEIQDYRERVRSLKVELKRDGLERSQLTYSAELTSLRYEVDSQVVTLASMMEKYTWNDQIVINLTIRLNVNMRLIEREVSDEVLLQYADATPEQHRWLTDRFVAAENIDVLDLKLRQLRLSLERMSERINLLPRLQAEIDELAGRVEDTRRYRDAFKSEEITVKILSEQAKERVKYKVIDPAQVPMAPYYPKRAQIALMGLLLGLIIGGMGALLTEMLDNSFKRVDDVEDSLGLPVVAVVPKIEKLKIR